LMELIIPLLRADFQLIQTYEYLSDVPLRSPITVYGGLQDDEETRDLLLPWREQTSSGFRLHMLPGDHFFLRSSQNLLLELLVQDLHEVTLLRKNAPSRVAVSVEDSKRSSIRRLGWR
jgi:medium-chain acyl-[acyl-carrier-protein] hydrolase